MWSRKHEKLETLVIEFRILRPALQRIKSSEIKSSNYFDCPIIFVSAIWFDCRTSIELIPWIVFDSVRLKYGSIAFDWLCWEYLGEDYWFIYLQLDIHES